MNYETDEETLEALKKWWKENGKSVIGGLVVGVAAIVGFNQWNDYQATQGQSASSLYQVMLDNNTGGKTDEFFANGTELVLEYAKTPYAPLASLVMAKKLIEDKKYDEAIKKLDWVLSNSKDDGIKHVARIRLARLFINENKIAEALKLVKDQQSTSFQSDYSELRGDVYAVKKEFSLAQEAYKSALASNIKNKEKREFIEMKLHDIVVTSQVNTEKS